MKEPWKLIRYFWSNTINIWIDLNKNQYNTWEEQTNSFEWLQSSMENLADISEPQIQSNDQ